MAWSCRFRGLVGLMFLIAAFPDPAVSRQYTIDVYKPDKVYPGTTIFGDESDAKHPMIVEVDMTGRVVWSYYIPSSLGRGRATDVEWIPASDHILFTRETGVYEVNRDKKIVWSYKGRASHDADRLANGNTLMAWAWGENSNDPEAREVDPQGNVVWEWHAAEHLAGERRMLDREGLTHTNSVIRLANGNTLVSLRNFYMLVEVAPSGQIVWKLPGLFTTPHDPEILANGNILVNTRDPQIIKEITPAGRVVWAYRPNQQDVQVVRYNHRLPNGNLIFVERTKIIEITPAREIVWQLRITNVPVKGDHRSRWLYKAERIPAGRRAAPTHAYLAPSETLAKSPGGAAPPRGEAEMVGPRGLSAREVIARNDRNGDGKLAADELPGLPQAFQMLDADGDGFVTAAEFEAFWSRRMAIAPQGSAGPRLPANGAPPSAPAAGDGEMPGPRGMTAREMIARNDRNGDGKLAADEFPGPAPAFQLLDADGDGFATTVEFEALWSRRIGQGQGGATGQGAIGHPPAKPGAS